MVKVQLELTEEENKKVNIYMSENNISDKREAIKSIVRSEMEKEVSNLDPKLDKNDKSFKSALILLMSLRLGTNMKDICAFLNFKYDKQAKEYESNLIKNKIWVDDKLSINWFDEKQGGISFWMDVLAMEGLIARTDYSNN